MSPAEEELQRLYERDGKLTPEQVVAEAVDPSSPLHSRFNWDDPSAAHSWRIEQASQLIRHFKIVVEVEPDRHVTVRRFTHVGSRDSYVPTQDAMIDHKDEIMAAAVAELESFRRKYDTLIDVDVAWNKARRKAARVKASS